MHACNFDRASQGRSSDGKLARRVRIRWSVFVLPVVLGSCHEVLNSDPPRRVAAVVLASGDWQAAEVGAALPHPLEVILVDNEGFGIGGIAVNFTGDGNALGPPVLSDAAGKASSRWQLGPVAGIQSIKVTIDYPDAPQAVFFQAEAVVGPAASIVLVGPSPTALPGTRLDTLTVNVADRFGNKIINGDISWSVEAGGGSVEALGAHTDQRGMARAIWTLGPSANTHSLRITSGAAAKLVVINAIAAFVGRQVVSGSDHSCAIADDGTAYCWGNNAWGQLGVGTRDWDPHPIAQRVVGAPKFRAIAAGATHSCGLAFSGETYCWGGNLAGQIGSAPSWDVFPLPTRVAAVPFTAITAGAFHTCGLTSGGVAWCWGDDSFGQLGSGSDRSRAVQYFQGGMHIPSVVAGAHTFSSLAADYSLTCGVTMSGDAYCWGDNDDLKLGSPVSQRCRFLAVDDNWEPLSEYDVPCSSSPVRVPTRASVSSIATSQHGNCAVLATSELECWGVFTPSRIIPGARVTQAWIFEATVCGTDASGAMHCWRWYTNGGVENPFGDGPTVVSIHSSGRHHCGLSSATLGTVYCWGTNYDGALGDGTTQHRTFPVAVAFPELSARVP